jgi:hypothetical protein
MYESLNHEVYAHKDRYLWLKDARICLYPGKKKKKNKNSTISAKESALIPLVIYQI